MARQQALLCRPIAVTNAEVVSTTLTETGTAWSATWPFALGEVAYDLTAGRKCESKTGGVAGAVTAVDAGTDRLSHSLGLIPNNTQVAIRSTGSVPGGLVQGTIYYVVNTLFGDAQLSATSGGAAINITSTGSGTIELVRTPNVNNPLPPAKEENTNWRDIGPTNRVAMFDGSHSSQSTATTSFEMKLAPGARFNCLGLFNLSKVTQVRIAAWLSGASRTNQVAWSEAFDQWTKTNVTVASDVGAVAGGALLADRLVPSTGSASHRVQSSTVNGTTWTHSVYVQADGYNLIALRESSQGAYAVFNVKTGAVVASNNAGTCTISAVTITVDAGMPGRYRCSARFSYSGSVSSAMAIIVLPSYVSGDPQSVALPGDGSSGVLVSNAQIESGSTLTPYVGPTTAGNATSSEHNFYDKVFDLRETAFADDWFAGVYAESVTRDRLSVSDIPPQASATVTLTLSGATGDVIGCGSCVPALSKGMGYTQLNPRIGIEKYSVFERNAYGDVIVDTSRGFSDQGSFDIYVDATKSSAVRQLLTANRDALLMMLMTPDAASPGGWNPSGSIYGYIRNFDLMVAQHKVHQISVELEGVT